MLTALPLWTSWGVLYIYIYRCTVYIYIYRCTVMLLFRYNVDCAASAGLYGLAEGAFGTQVISKTTKLKGNVQKKKKYELRTCQKTGEGVFPLSAFIFTLIIITSLNIEIFLLLENCCFFIIVRFIPF